MAHVVHVHTQSVVQCTHSGYHLPCIALFSNVLCDLPLYITLCVLLKKFPLFSMSYLQYHDSVFPIDSICQGLKGESVQF